MAFVKTTEYYESKIRNINNAIIGTKACIQDAKIDGNTRAVEAHTSYLMSIQKNLIEAKAEFCKFEASK